MNLADLLDLDIIASLDGDGGLLLDAPKGALDAAVIERIHQSKPGLIAELQWAREDGELHRQCIGHPGKGIDHGGEVHQAWLVRYLYRDPVALHAAPALSHDELLAAYADAVAAEPAAQRAGTRPETAHEQVELLALIRAIYADDADQDRAEAATLLDPEGAMACYRAIAAERGIVVSAQKIGPASVSVVIGCKTCQHRRRPGLASPGYCSGRDDLPLAYGLHHPLRRLPDDRGVTCASYTPHEG